MPRPSAPKPPVMTWRKASLYLGLAVFFDVLRFFCEVFFWLLGPALVAYYVSNKILWGGAVSNIAGATVGAAAGYFGLPIFMFFGMILGVLFGFVGWLLICFLLMFFNRRIFSVHITNIIWSIVGLAVSEMPFVGVLPSLTSTTFYLFHRQIKSDKEALAIWKKENAKIAAQEAQERQQIRANAQAQLSVRALQQAQAEEMAAAEAEEDEAVEENDLFDELARQAANDNDPGRSRTSLAA